jgi:hypothetical protein
MPTIILTALAVLGGAGFGWLILSVASSLL